MRSDVTWLHVIILYSPLIDALFLFLFYSLAVAFCVGIQLPWIAPLGTNKVLLNCICSVNKKNHWLCFSCSLPASFPHLQLLSTIACSLAGQMSQACRNLRSQHLWGSVYLFSIFFIRRLVFWYHHNGCVANECEEGQVYYHPSRATQYSHLFYQRFCRFYYSWSWLPRCTLTPTELSWCSQE